LPNFKDLQDAPFVDGGRDPATGLDCWGLFRLAMQRYGHDVPDFKVSAFASNEIGATVTVELMGGRWNPIEKPYPGCAALMALDPYAPRVIQHFGVYTGENGCKFLHTLEKTGPILSPINQPPWSRVIKGFCEWIPITT
jgi:cell wall-associated NlpC family hydrolase